MKKKRFADYKYLFLPPGMIVPGRSEILRKAGGFIGYHITALLMLYVLLWIMYLPDGNILIPLPHMFGVYFITLISVTAERFTADIYRPSSSKNKFFCMIPNKETVIKKSVICYELYRTGSLALAALLSELSAFAVKGVFSFERIIFSCMFFSLMITVISYCLRTSGNVLLIALIYFFTFVITVIVMTNDSIASIAGKSDGGLPVFINIPTCILITAAAVLAGFFLNRKTYRMLCSAGR